MSEYLILIYDAEAPYANASPELWQEVMQAHQQFRVGRRRPLRYRRAIVIIRRLSAVSGASPSWSQKPVAAKPASSSRSRNSTATNIRTENENRRNCPPRTSARSVVARPVIGSNREWSIERSPSRSTTTAGSSQTSSPRAAASSRATALVRGQVGGAATPGRGRPPRRCCRRGRGCRPRSSWDGRSRASRVRRCRSRPPPRQQHGRRPPSPGRAP